MSFFTITTGNGLNFSEKTTDGGTVNIGGGSGNASTINTTSDNSAGSSGSNAREVSEGDAPRGPRNQPVRNKNRGGKSKKKR